MKNINDLIAILDLEQLSENTFKGISKTIGSPNVFGGQVAAQALNAAYRTVEENRFVHSLHSYFLRPGNLLKPILFEVENLRDGRSFSTRRVTALQDDKAIFIMAASFQIVEDGHDYQKEIITDIAEPEDLLSWTEMVDKYEDILPKPMLSYLSIDRPVEFKPTQILNPFEQKDLPAEENVWFKLKGTIPSDISLPLKHQLLAYISDYPILNAVLKPHGSKAHYGNTQMASLDHSMWFYRDFNFDDWMLFTAEAPNTFGARGFSRGNIFSRDGKLIASVAQEGLMRPKTY